MSARKTMEDALKLVSIQLARINVSALMATKWLKMARSVFVSYRVHPILLS